MKIFTVHLNDFGLDVLISPIDKKEIYKNQDLLLSIVDEYIVPNIACWDYKGFLNGVSSLRDLSQLKNPENVEEVLRKFDTSKMVEFNDFLDFEGYEYFLLEEYILTLGKNIFAINTESSEVCFTSVCDMNETFYLKDDQNTMKEVSQEDFIGILVNNKI